MLNLILEISWLTQMNFQYRTSIMGITSRHSPTPVFSTEVSLILKIQIDRFKSLDIYEGIDYEMVSENKKKVCSSFDSRNVWKTKSRM